MGDLLIFYFLSTLTAYCILRLLFGSAIFGWYRRLLETVSNDACKSRNHWKYIVVYPLRCWQCSGVWVSVMVTSSWLLYGNYSFPVDYIKWFFTALAVAVTTDVIAEFIPLTVATLELPQEEDKPDTDNL